MTGLAEQERNFLNDSLISFSLCLFGIFLALTWVFSSWTRPLVVMSIIPFGLIGTIWGHYFWQIPMSLFSVIGLIGMTGIIINDSIVLVSTINEYEEKNHSEPVIDAICDRLRPVLLTTLTTVFGLIVAIILQVFYNYIIAKIDSIVNDMEDASITLIDILSANKK